MVKRPDLLDPRGLADLGEGVGDGLPGKSLASVLRSPANSFITLPIFPAGTARSATCL
jgi:hypothetical protein